MPRCPHCDHEGSIGSFEYVVNYTQQEEGFDVTLGMHEPDWADESFREEGQTYVVCPGCEAVLGSSATAQARNVCNYSKYGPHSDSDAF